MKNSVTHFEHPFLKGMDAHMAQEFLHGAVEQEFKPGDIIFRERDPANRFYLIAAGKVAIESTSGSRTPLHVGEVGAGEVLGWSWLFPPFTWHFQARAVEPTRALACDGARLLVRAEEHPTFGFELMKRISRVLIQRLQTTRDLYVKSQTHEPALAPR